VLKDYDDAWSEAVSKNAARGILSGSTRVGKDGRIDFIFFTPGKKLRLEWVETVDSARLVGEAVSDHQPVVAHFRAD
jgi:endonuclease/exonuclease/phosphatase family metal-dependent hydrolase